MAERKTTWGRFWDAASHPTRDGVLFITGVVGILWQTFGEDVDRPYLLVAFVSMCGLPVFLNLDEHNPFGKFPRTGPVTKKGEEGDSDGP